MGPINYPVISPRCRKLDPPIKTIQRHADILLGPSWSIINQLCPLCEMGKIVAEQSTAWRALRVLNQKGLNYPKRVELLGGRGETDFLSRTLLEKLYISLQNWNPSSHSPTRRCHRLSLILPVLPILHFASSSRPNRSQTKGDIENNPTQQILFSSTKSLGGRWWTPRKRCNRRSQLNGNRIDLFFKVAAAATIIHMYVFFHLKLLQTGQVENPHKSHLPMGRGWFEINSKCSTISNIIPACSVRGEEKLLPIISNIVLIILLCIIIQLKS